MKLGKFDIPHIEIEEISLRKHSYQTKLYLQFSDFVQHNSKGQAIKKALENDERIKSLRKAYSDENISFDINRLTYWFIWRINLFGQAEAEKNLNTYLDESHVETIYTSWILGIKIDQTINLFDNIIIEPIENMIDSDYKEAFLQGRWTSYPFRTPTPDCAIITREKSEKTITNTINLSKHQQLEDIALILNLISNTSCLSYWQTANLDEKYPYGPFNASAGSSSIYDVVGDKSQKLSLSDFSEIESLYKSFSELKQKDRSRFYTIIHRIRQAKRRNSIEDKILDLVVSLEMMLLEDNDKTQLKLQFRLRGSLLISTTDTDKTTYFSILGKLYDYRSSVAHSGILKESDKVTIKEKFPDFCNLTEKICKKLILDGKPDWDKLVLGIES